MLVYYSGFSLVNVQLCLAESENEVQKFTQLL